MPVVGSTSAALEAMDAVFADNLVVGHEREGACWLLQAVVGVYLHTAGEWHGQL